MNKKNKIEIKILANIIDPIAPEYVLFGLIFVNLRPLKNFPNK